MRFDDDFTLCLRQPSIVLGSDRGVIRDRQSCTADRLGCGIGLGPPCIEGLGRNGANGSGKTNVLKPLAFLAWFLSSSFPYVVAGNTVPIRPHASRLDEPSDFEIEFEFEGRRWRYRLTATQRGVLAETLDVVKVRWNTVFERRHGDGGDTYTFRSEFPMQRDRAAETRGNCSIIAAAAQYGIPLAARLAEYFGAFDSNVIEVGRAPAFDTIQGASQRFMERPEQKVVMERLLSEWDLGLNGVEIAQVSGLAQINTLVSGGGAVSNIPQHITVLNWVPFGIHQAAGSEFKLPFEAESKGTRSAFVLLSHILQTLASGSVAVIDEIETDLHPHMLERLFDLFANPDTNPRNAQLICSTHCPEVLRWLDKPQIILVQKRDCISEAYRLDTVTYIRSDANLYAQYMAGGFGGVPNL